MGPVGSGSLLTGAAMFQRAALLMLASEMHFFPPPFRTSSRTAARQCCDHCTKDYSRLFAIACSSPGRLGSQARALHSVTPMQRGHETAVRTAERYRAPDNSAEH